jgi:3-oxoacyl-[acyl-carrier protein] reductase
VIPEPFQKNEPMMSLGDVADTLSLHGKTILVTGVSRSTGIGAAIVHVLAKAGAVVLAHGYSPYDQSMQYADANPAFADELSAEINVSGGEMHLLSASDLSQADAVDGLMKEAALFPGRIDGLVLNHAYSTHASIGSWTTADIDKHLQTNVRAAMLLIQAFAAQLPNGKRGAITLFTSGQYLGPMVDEIAYAVSKDAIIGLCRQAAAALADQNIQVNCINPGPTDTGYMSGEPYQQIADRFPAKRWGMPDDAARLVHFLQSDYSAWITGQIIASEGGFLR